MISQKNKQGWRNPWVIGLALIVLSGVLTNARMVWNVVHYPMRLLDDDYSVKSHNQYDAKWVQQQSERSTLGWNVNIHSSQRLKNDPLAEGIYARFLIMATPAPFKLELSDHEGNPIQGGQIKLNAQWPANPDFDTSSTLYETAAGVYEGSLEFSRPGNWDVLINAQLDGRPFEMEQRVYVVIEGK